MLQQAQHDSAEKQMPNKKIEAKAGLQQPINTATAFQKRKNLNRYVLSLNIKSIT